MHLSKICLRGVLALLIVVLFNHHARAQDWTQWRGPNRDGHVNAFTEPSAWPDSLKSIWRINAGVGLSSPVVANGKIYLLTRDGEDEVVSCYLIADGRRIWQQRYPASFIANPQAIRPDLFPASKGKGPFATPVVHGGRLYTLGVDRVLSCFDAESGKLKWRHQYIKQFVPEKLVYECPPCGCKLDGQEFDNPGKCSDCGMDFGVKGLETSAKDVGNYYGAAASPIIDGKIGIVNVGGQDAGEVIAFDASNGKERWRWSGPSPSSSSPIIAELHGVRQVIVLTRESVAGIALANGRQLWSYAIESNAQIVTPIVFEDLVIFSAYRSPTTAIRIQKNGATWSVEKAWSINDVTLYTSTPVLIGDKLYGLSYTKRGQFFCLDARAGTLLWASEGRQAEGAAIVNSDNVIFALTNEAKLVAFAKTEAAYQLVAQYEVASSPTWAHPILFEKKILVKDESKLMLWSLE